MKYKAVIFDLFGTLIENLPSPEYKRLLADVALVLSADKEKLISLWNERFDELMTGSLEVEKCIDYVCGQMGLVPENEVTNNAHKVITDLVSTKLIPAPGTLSVLSQLNVKNCRTGLISNCSNEVPLLWEDSPLATLIDEPVFSCSVGLKKPDPYIYKLAVELLAVEPEECLFVDDNLEPLEGASKLGMTAVLIQDSGLNSPLIDPGVWSGYIISSLTGVMPLLDM